MKYKIIFIALLAIVTWLTISSNSAGLGNVNSNCANCHKGGTGTSIDSLVLIDNITGLRSNNSYIAGRSYTISIFGKNTNALAGFGFQVNNKGKGVFTANPSGTSISDSIWGHSSTLLGVSGSYTSTATWTAPTAGTGTVTLSSILCAVNNDSDTSGDASSTVFTKSLSEYTLTAAVSIAASTTSYTCKGNAITFKATPTNGGSAPSYEWKINGVVTGGTVDTFTTTALNNGDIVSCAMTSSLVGVTGSPANSNFISANITNLFQDTVSITSNSTKDSVCAGGTLTFTAKYNTACTSPKFLWYVNGVVVSGQTSSTFVKTGFQNNDVINCRMSVANACPLYDTAMSNYKVIYQKLSPTIVGTMDQTLCNGYLAQMITWVKSPSTATTQWTNTKTSIGLAASGTKDTLPAFIAKTTALKNDTAIVSVVVTSNGCTNYPTQIKYIVIPSPKVTVPASKTVCTNASQAITTFSSTIPSATIYWTSSNPAIGTDPNGIGNLPAFVPTNMTNDTISSNITVTAIYNTCTSKDTSYKIIVAPNVVTNKIDSQFVCNGAYMDTIRFSSNIANATYTWTNSNTSIGLAASGSTKFIPKFKAINTGTTIIYAKIKVKVAYNGCSGADTSFVIAVLPTSPITIAISTSSKTDICYNDTVKFKSTISSGTLKPIYQWNINGVAIAGQNGDSFVYNSWNPLDTVTCTLVTSNTCLALTSKTSNKLGLTVHTSVSPTLALISKDTICSGTSVAFTTKDTLKGLNPVYKWMKNSTVVGSNSNTYSTATLANGDTITCMLTSGYSCAIPRPVTVSKIMTVITSVVPTVSISTNLTKICAGDIVHYTPNVTNGGLSPKYKWYFNNVVVDTLYTSKDFTLNSASDNVQFEVVSSATCATPSLVRTTAPKPSIGSFAGITLTPSVLDSFCYNDSSLVQINTSTPSSYTFLWSNGKTSQSFYSKITQSYVVTVTEKTNNCVQIFGPITTHRNPLQIKPTLTVSDNYIVASYATSYYRWFVNGQEQIGQSTNKLLYSGKSKYMVIAYNYGNCSDTSDILDLTNLDISNITSNALISITPNPVTNHQFSINIDAVGSKNIEIYNALGVKVDQMTTNLRSLEIKDSKLSAGVYFIRAFVKNEIFTTKFIVE